MNKKLLAITCLGFLLYSVDTLAQEQKFYGENGQLSFIKLDPNDNLVNKQNQQFVFERYFKINQSTTYKSIKSEEDELGNFHEKFQFYHNSIPIVGAEYIVHSTKDGNINSLNGKFVEIKELSTTPGFSANDARSKALNIARLEDSNLADSHILSVSLVILPILKESGEEKVLAYKVNFFSIQYSGDLYIDAKTGGKLRFDTRIYHQGKYSHQHLQDDNQQELINQTSSLANKENSLVYVDSYDGKGDSRYSGNVAFKTTKSGLNYILNDTTRGGGISTKNVKGIKLSNLNDLNNAKEFQDADNIWSQKEYDNADKDNVAIDVHWGLSKVYDYFKNIHKRDGYDNKSSVLKGYVHYDTIPDNAGWYSSGDGTGFMLYGDGKTLFTPLGSLDVTAHEVGHGVTGSGPKLTYERESGALNEALSDIWGVSVENYYLSSAKDSNKDIWMLGEEITIDRVRKGLRSMSDPKSRDQPDTYLGQKWLKADSNSCPNPNKDTNDNCGVHINSGVINHWFYILVAGKKGVNDIGNSYDVAGIGSDKAEKLVYNTLTKYLISTSTFNDFRLGVLSSAENLYGKNSNELIQATNAFYAVNIGDKYKSQTDTIVPTTPTNLKLTSATSSTISLSWNASTDNVGVTGYSIFQNNVLLGSVTELAVNVTNLAPNTEYNYYIVAKDAAGNASSKSNLITAKTLPLNSYCTPSASTAYEYISAIGISKLAYYDVVSFGNKDDKGYGNYKDKGVITLEKGESYFLTVAKSNSTINNYYNNVGAWIDFNGDGEFSDNESIGLVKKTTDYLIHLPWFTVPTDASNNQVVMRVGIRSNGDLSACDTNINGEYEDYTVSFNKSNGVTNLTTNNALESKISIYPNPVDNELFIKGVKSKVNYKLFNLNGGLINGGEIVNGKSINVKQLPKGVYILEINENGKVTTEKIIKK